MFTSLVWHSAHSTAMIHTGDTKTQIYISVKTMKGQFLFINFEQYAILLIGK